MAIAALTAIKWAEEGRKAALLTAHGFAHGFEPLAPGAGLPRNPQHFRQVHGTTILAAQPERSAPGVAERAAADGIYSRRTGEAIAVRTADCLPLLLADRERGLVMAVHAGWRGLTAGILPAAIALAAELGVPAERLLLAVGPAIAREAFEVGPEVVAALQAAPARLSGEQAALATAKGKGDRWHVDLHVAAALQALNAGVPAAQIEVILACTVSGAGGWQSYRRAQGCGQALTSMNWSWIEL